MIGAFILGVVVGAVGLALFCVLGTASEIARPTPKIDQAAKLRELFNK